MLDPRQHGLDHMGLDAGSPSTWTGSHGSGCWIPVNMDWITWVWMLDPRQHGLDHMGLDAGSPSTWTGSHGSGCWIPVNMDWITWVWMLDPGQHGLDHMGLDHMGLDHMVLVEGLCEVSVCSAEEASDLYQTGRRRLVDTAAPVSSRLQLLGLAGGVSKNHLRGVSPLVKVLDQIQLGTRTSNKLLPFLLTDALTGNGRTCLLYCIPPQEGKGSVEHVQEGVMRIQQLRESLNHEMKNSGFPSEKSDSSHPLEYSGVLERRRQTKEDHEQLIQEELEKMEEELKQEKAEGVQRDLLVMARERRVVAVQIEALRAEALQAKRDLEQQHHLHQRDLQRLREESLKVFQVFHQVSEEQKRTIKGRYRSLLLEAIQDAVHLSAQNQQLRAENHVHRVGRPWWTLVVENTRAVANL
ncbi:hypothetical protein NHX12_011554 [Muraenolepis orangiensis]|uniref:Kinesin motor domain-containing protein n=1 Tax=Muraenolepis orangiensis TaxID=630683 RepID=A0A9Q0DFE0_9TELE|nr:hypothetical protein NHX12_011554 [Muraenolepis orangiensis]